MCSLHATGIDLTARARVRRLCRFIASESTMISGHRSTAREHFHTTCRVTAQTPGPQRPYSMANLSEQLVAILCNNRVGRANVAEISLTWLIAQQFAAQHPNRIDIWSCSTLPAQYNEMRCMGSVRANQWRQAAIGPKLASHPTRRSLRAHGVRTCLPRATRWRANRSPPPSCVPMRSQFARRTRETRVCSGELGLGNLLEHAPLGLDADKNERDRGDQIGQREGV